MSSIYRNKHKVTMEDFDSDDHWFLNNRITGAWVDFHAKQITLSDFQGEFANIKVTFNQMGKDSKGRPTIEVITHLCEKQLKRPILLQGLSASALLLDKAVKDFISILEYKTYRVIVR